MITGVVRGSEATVRFRVKDASGQERDLAGIIDSGFTGSLTLPPWLIRSFGLRWRSRGTAILANGAVDQFDIYEATVIWDGVPRRVLVEEADTGPLVGMALLRGYDLMIRVVPGGRVTITAVP